MTRYAGALVVLVVLVAVMSFARGNGAEEVTLNLGLRTFQRVPLPYVAFGSLFLGMLVMLIAGIHSDLKVRRFLRQRLWEEALREGSATDRNQRDLFASPSEEEEGEP